MDEQTYSLIQAGDPKKFLMAQLNKPPLMSKKAMAAVLGTACVMLVWFGSLITMVIKPEVASSVVTLGSTVIIFVGTLNSVLITGQSAVDWKTTSAIANTVTSEHHEEHHDDH